MKKRLFTGAGVAIVTPMHPDLSVNYDKLGELIDFHLANGTDSLIVCGTTGESSTLEHVEHCDVIQYAIDRVGGRIPVIAGTGSNDTAYAIQLSKEAEKMGADGLLVVTPYYNKTSQRGLIQHYKAIAESVHTPIILYNVPSRTGVNIAPETYAELCKLENIVATKEASGNISHILKVKQLCGENLDIYSGNDDQIVPLLAVGGIGVISVISNILPQETHDICELYLNGKTQESLDLQLKYLDLMGALFLDVNPIPIKEAMNLLGYEVGQCRLPLYAMSDAGRSKLADALKAAGLLK